MDKAKIGAKVSCDVIANNGMQMPVGIHSLWTTECYDAQGNLKWVEKDRPNVCTTEGINFMLDVMFHGTAAKGTWYVALYEDTAYVPAITDTYHAWADSLVTECTAYDEANRVAYVEAAASSKVTTNTASKASFTMNDTKTIQGAALVSLNTKSDHTVGDYIFCVSDFAVARSVVATDVLRVTIAITGADT